MRASVSWCSGVAFWAETLFLQVACRSPAVPCSAVAPHSQPEASSGCGAFSAWHTGHRGTQELPSTNEGRDWGSIPRLLTRGSDRSEAPTLFCTVLLQVWFQASDICVPRDWDRNADSRSRSVPGGPHGHGGRGPAGCPHLPCDSRASSSSRPFYMVSQRFLPPRLGCSTGDWLMNCPGGSRCNPRLTPPLDL